MVLDASKPAAHREASLKPLVLTHCSTCSGCKSSLCSCLLAYRHVGRISQADVVLPLRRQTSQHGVAACCNSCMWTLRRS